MGPSQDPSPPEKNQVARICVPRKRRARRPRSRPCLLKGCKRRFRPRHPLARYCSGDCQDKARRWREWKARHRYRHTEGGKQKRRAQSQRYRERHPNTRGARRERREPREGHRKGKNLTARAIDPVAMKSFSAANARPCSASVPVCVDGLWSGFWNANAAGESGGRHGTAGCNQASGRCLGGRNAPEIVPRYCVSSGSVNRFGIAYTQKRKKERSQPKQ